jgi:hypothetical protein
MGEEVVERPSVFKPLVDMLGSGSGRNLRTGCLFDYEVP